MILCVPSWCFTRQPYQRGCKLYKTMSTCHASCRASSNESWRVSLKRARVHYNSLKKYPCLVQFDPWGFSVSNTTTFYSENVNQPLRRKQSETSKDVAHGSFSQSLTGNRLYECSASNTAHKKLHSQLRVPRPLEISQCGIEQVDTCEAEPRRSRLQNHPWNTLSLPCEASILLSSGWVV